MKHLLFFLLAFPFLASAQILEKQFVATVQYNGFTQINDSLYRGDLIEFRDVLIEGYQPSGVDSGFICLDGTGRAYRVEVINSFDYSSLNVDLIELDDYDEIPIGVGIVAERYGSTFQIPNGLVNSIGISSVLQAKILNHNTKIAATTVQPPDTLYLQELSGTTAISDGDTIPLIDYVRVVDTTTAFASYLKRPVGWGLSLLTGKYPFIDSLKVASRYYVGANFFPLQGGTLTGTGGAGFIGFPSQVSAPGAPASGLNVYAQGSSFNWKGTDGYERQFASTLTGGRTYALPDISGTFVLGTGTADRLSRWTGTNTLAAGNLSDNGTRLAALLPWQFQTYTTAGLPTGVTGYHVYNTTTNGPGWYQGSRWAYGLESTFNRGTALYVPNFDANGQIQNSPMLIQADGDIFNNGAVDGGEYANFKMSGTSGQYRNIIFDGMAANVQPILALKGGGPFLQMFNSSNNAHMSIGMTTYTGGRGIQVRYATGTVAGTADRHQFQANGTSVMTLETAGIAFGGFSAAYDLDMFGKVGAIRTSSGSTAQRPTPLAALFRNNTDSTFWEGHDGTAWRMFASRTWVRSNFARSSSLTTNRLPKWNGSSLVNSSWEDDGTQLLALNNLPVRAKDIETNSGVIELSAGFGAPAIRSRSSSPSTSDNNGLQIISEDAGSIIFTVGKKSNTGWIEVLRADTTGVKYKQNLPAIPGRASVIAYSTYFAGSAGDTLITGTYQFTQDRTFQILGDGTGIFPKIVGRGYGLGNKEASDLSKTQSAYIASWATDGTLLDYPLSSLGNGIYGGSATLNQHTTRARIPNDGNFLISQLFNSDADSAYIQVINGLDGNREVRGGLTDTASVGYSTFRFYQDEADEETGFDLRSLDNTGNTRVLAQGGNIRLIGSNIATLESAGEVRLLGLVQAKQEAYNEITSTSSPQTLSSDYPDNLINQGGTQATFTLEMPASPDDGQVCTITFNNAISTLTIDGNGETIVGSAVVTGVPGSQRKFKFYSGIGWIKLY